MSDDYIEQLISRMSLAQKVGQMTMAERMFVTTDEVTRYHLGAILSGGGSQPEGNTPADWVQMNDAFWAASMADDANHVPIPILYGVDAVHGNNNVAGATIFPHNIGLGASGDIDLVARAAAVTAKEVLATGVDWTFAPTLAVADDFRWGRTYESYTDDTVRVGQYGEAYIKALQSDLGDHGLMGCAKHWVGDGATTNGIDQGETTLSWETLEQRHIAPYYPVLKAGVLSVMVSFNSWNGDKCHGHYHLITEVLKDQLGFTGIVVSDWDGIDYIDEDYAVCIEKSVNAGIDMFMAPEKWQDFIKGLIDCVNQGRVPLSRIDDAVQRILLVKQQFGLFEKPRPAERCLSNHESFGSLEHRRIAQEAVRKSLVLLKNEGQLLPLASSQRVLVAGKNAHDLGAQCGGFTLSWQGESGSETISGTTIWQGIKNICPDAELNDDVAAINAKNFDVAVVVVGESAYAEGMGDIRSGDHLLVEAGSTIKGSMNPLGPYGQSLKLAELHPEDLATIEAVRAKGLPMVVVLISGRPLLVDQEISSADAFVAAWLPGSEGLGIAENLFGLEAFSGKLPFTWPKQASLGCATGGVLFERGFGLTAKRTA
jgi:beta-glucosidase